MVVTVLERKTRKVERLRAAVKAVMARLKDYADLNAGRYVVFGSAAREQLSFDSDLDVIVDFPGALERQANDFAEMVCRECAVPADIRLIGDASPALMARVHRDGVVLS